MRRNVQRLEVVKIVLDFRPLLDSETHLGKQGFDALHGARYRVQATAALAASRQGNIDFFAGQLRLQFCLFQLGFFGFQPLLHLLLGLVDLLTRRLALVAGQAAECFQQGSEFAFFAEVVYPYGVERLQIISRIDFSLRFCR